MSRMVQWAQMPPCLLLLQQVLLQQHLPSHNLLGALVEVFPVHLADWCPINSRRAIDTHE
jgi:hypothetical protein